MGGGGGGGGSKSPVGEGRSYRKNLVGQMGLGEQDRIFFVADGLLFGNRAADEQDIDEMGVDFQEFPVKQRQLNFGRSDFGIAPDVGAVVTA